MQRVGGGGTGVGPGYRMKGCRVLIVGVGQSRVQGARGGRVPGGRVQSVGCGGQG